MSCWNAKSFEGTSMPVELYIGTTVARPDQKKIRTFSDLVWWELSVIPCYQNGLALELIRQVTSTLVKCGLVAWRTLRHAGLPYDDVEIARLVYLRNLVIGQRC
ncbi:jg16470 [Pararge aegeria aegeria]|uniref:Jg16470 protein n=1 Tax=Pararge aegeria aegeria TaxID=348720 RepID=A0A8S4RJA7_9NEOP|nr:jg16470 [Pararge aegeria aegeria]